MIKFGLISELGKDENAGYARVWFDDVDIVSDWLALPSIATKTAKQWIPIEINSQVACVIDDDTEQGYISIVLWSETDTPPEWATEGTMGIMFADGAEFYYDAKAHTLTVNAENIIFNGGDNKGMVIAPELKTQLEKMTARIDGIIDAIKNAVPVPQDGGAGLQSTMKAGLAAITDIEDFSNIENEHITH